MMRFSLCYFGFWMWTPLATLAGLTLVSPSQAQVPSVSLTTPAITEKPLRPSTQAIDLMPPALDRSPASENTRSDGTFSPSLNSVAHSDEEQKRANPMIAEVSPGAAPSSVPSAPSPQEDPNIGVRLPVNAAEGVPIEQVFVYLRNPTNNPEQDEALRRQLANTFGIRAGENFSPLFADQGLNQVQRLPLVQSAAYRLYRSNRLGTVIVALLVTLQSPTSEKPPAPKPPTGLLTSGNFRDFPTIYQSDHNLYKFILNGGVGVFSDTNPWFGNANTFVSGPYRPTDTITWGEAYLEPGLAGITRLGSAPVYLYGAGSYTLSGTLQPDIFRTDDRFYADVEKLYGGVLVAEPGSPLSFNLSAGRQIFQLNQGFLFSQFSGSANALDRAASYSNPRTAYDMTVLANLRWGNFRLQGFFLKPDELPVADTDTRYLGTSLHYNNNQGVEAVLTYVTVPQSSRTYPLPGRKQFTREGLQVINPRLRFSSLFGVSGLWLEGEYAYQFSNQRSMSAQGGYLRLGYTAQDAPWKPSISYRFAGFSGDNPNTDTYERFDPLQASGLTDWLQGISLSKVYNNSNGFSHRVTFEVQPSDRLSISLNYYYRFADQLNNLGGNPTLATLKSRDIGHEVLLISRYTLSQNFLLQGVGSIAFPGSAIRQAVDGSPAPWITLQLSLFMFF